MRGVIGPASSDGRDAARMIGAGIVARLGGSAVGTLAGLGTTLLAVRLLGVGPYGALAFGLAFVALASAVARLGLGGAVVRSIAAATAAGRADAVTTIVRGATGIVLVSGGVAAAALAVVLVAVTPDLAPFAGPVLGASLAVLLIGRIGAAAARFVAQGLGRMAWTELPGLIVTTLQLLGVGAVSAAGIADVRAVACAYGVAGAVAFAASAATVRRMVGRGWRALVPRRDAALRLLRTAAPYAISGVAVQVVSQLDVVVLGIARGSVEVGRYEPMLRLADRLLLLVPALFLTGFLPAATALAVRGERGAFRDLYVDTSKVVLVLAMPLACSLLAVPEVWVRTLFGESFPASPLVVRVLVIGYVANLAFGLNTSALVASGSRRALVLAHAVGFACMVVLAAALIPAFGALGAAAATSASYVALNVAVGAALLRVAGVHPFRRDLVVTLVTGVVVLVGALRLAGGVEGGSLLDAAAWGVAPWVVWVAALMAAGALRSHELLAFLPSRRRVG